MSTLSGVGGHPGKLGAGQAFAFKVRGVGPVPTSASSALVQVFALNATAQTQLSMWTSPLPNPLLPNFSVGPGQVHSNLAEIPFSSSGAVTVYNSAGATDVVVVVVGWNVPSGPTSAGLYLPEPPFRVLDTRNGIGGPMAPIGPGQTRTVQVAGVGPVPATGVAAVSLDLTPVNPTAAGTMTVWPAGNAQPSVPSLAFAPGQALTGHLEVPLSASGAISLYNSSSAPVDVTADTEGSFSDGTGPSTTSGLLVGVLPSLLANPVPQLQSQGTLGPGQTVTLQVAGLSGVPGSGAAAVLLNVTAGGASAAGTLTLWAGGTPPPGTIELTYPASAAASNFVTVQLSATGTIVVFNGGTAPVYVQTSLQGWFMS
jgi:hypothetical protein